VFELRRAIVRTMPPVTDQLVEQVRARCEIYRLAFEADIARLAKKHGHAPVREALLRWPR
jgi:hypothetical protein